MPLQKPETLKRKVTSCINCGKPSASLYIIIITVTMAAIAVTILLAQKDHREIERLCAEQFNQQQLILAHLAATGIQHFMAEIEDEICALSNSPAVQKMEPVMLEQMALFFMGIPQETSSRRLDKNGILRFIYPYKGWRKDLKGQDYSHETYFQKAGETGKIVISSLIINEIGEWRVRVTKPVYIEDEKGIRRFNGVIIGSFDPEKLSKLYISPIVSGETGYACLLSEDGLFMANYEKQFIGKDAFKVRAERNSDISYNTINNIQLKMMAGEEGTGRYVSGWHRGERRKLEKLIAYTPVHVYDKVWSVSVCAPVDEVEWITSKLYRNKLYSLGFIILILTASGVFFFISLYHRARYLEQEIKMRKEAQERINYLNAALRTVRNINRLITKVKDREELLQGACDNLIETMGIYSAWIALIEENGIEKDGLEKDGSFVTATHAGVDTGFAEMVDDLKRGKLTPCIRQAVDRPGVVVITNPAVECGNCRMIATYADKARVIGRLEYGDHIYGFLAVTVSMEMAVDDEERSLFCEMADDIAFALHNIEMEARQMQTEEELAKHRDHLEELVEARTSELETAQETMLNLVENLNKSRDELENRALELEEVNIELQKATRLKSQFLANMSHELRTPLNSIIGFTGIILQGIAGELNDEQKKQLNMVYGSAKHLLVLINDILDLSKIEAGKIEIIPAEFEIRELVQSVEKMVSPMIEKNGLTLQVAVSGNVPATICNDKNRIKQVLINLLSNAIKFTKYGKIQLCVEKAEGSKLRAKRESGSFQLSASDFELHRDWLVISVRDTGIGIKPEHLSDIFDEFRQIEDASKEKPTGTGLGLAISRKMVEMMGGYIRVESIYEKGSCFQFTIPVKEISAEKRPSLILPEAIAIAIEI